MQILPDTQQWELGSFLYIYPSIYAKPTLIFYQKAQFLSYFLGKINPNKLIHFLKPIFTKDANYSWAVPYVISLVVLFRHVFIQVFFSFVYVCCRIGISEKGHATVKLSVSMKPGHSSMPPKQSSIGILAAAVTRWTTQPASIIYNYCYSYYFPVFYLILTLDLSSCEDICTFFLLSLIKNSDFSTSTKNYIVTCALKEFQQLSTCRILCNYHVQ